MISELQKEILRLKEETGTVILAHSYQAPEILEIADHKGDSFALSVAAKDLRCDRVILCGVRFMADTVKMLSPEKTVLLPIAQATCPMAEQISPERVLEYKKSHPNAVVVAYVNTTTELKAVCDVCVTSSSALKIVEQLDASEILFIPDQNLGSYIKKQLPHKNIVLWDGYCPVHNSVTEEDCIRAKQQYPGMKILMHPELPAQVLEYGDVIGSTAAIIRYAMEHDEDCIIGTEKSISDYLSLMRPGRRYPLLSKRLMCPDMRLTTLLDVYKALTGQGGEEIQIPEDLRLKAKRSVDEMIRMG